MNFDILSLLPELSFFLLVLILFFGSLVHGRCPETSEQILRALPWLALLLVLTAAGSLGAERLMFWGSYQADTVSQFFKLLVSAGFAVCVFNACKQAELEETNRADYYLFLTMSAWGLILLSSAVELVTIYLSMELASYSLYILIPLRAKTKQSAEAGIKYIFFGAAATAIALYGLSWIIAGQHTTYLAELVTKDWSLHFSTLPALGLIFFLVGMFYKLALFPFHFWCPDVYQGASNETAAYAATLPKLGAIVILVRLGTLISPGEPVTMTIAILAAASMTLGNLFALVQNDLKRMLGFSSVAHAGYILVALVSGTPQGLTAAAFYALAYVLMNLLCFWIICRLAPDGRNLTYRDLNGLSRRSPWLALALAAAAFSLVGLPPTVGFIGKLWLITSAWGYGYDWLVVLLCLNSAIAIYYYLSLVRHAYTEGEDDPLRGAAPDTSPMATFGALVLAVAVLILGVIPAPVYDLAAAAGMRLF